MLGRPKYKYGDEVRFYYDNGKQKFERFGRVEVIDIFGTWEQNKEPSYDIMGIDDIFYKHIVEIDVFPLDKNEEYI